MALSDIEHIVVLVMENRSFDHMLGYLSLTGNRSDVDGLKPGMTNLNPHTGLPVGPVLLQDARFAPDPDHDHLSVLRQLGPFHGDVATMGGFVASYADVARVKEPAAIMGYYDEKTNWFYDFLAREYMVCDRWFCSFPGPTQVNRAFLLAGHSADKISNGEMIAHTATHRLPTLFDVLSHAGVSWKSYFHDVPALRSFIQFTFHIGHIRSIRKFYEDAASGNLPAVSWIDPNFELQGTLGFADGGNDDHPPADIRYGQQLVHDIYSALTANAQQWQKTLFIVTYDEHGGFFDHVSPPLEKSRAPFKTARFERFGVRVPAFVVSPWVDAKSVHHGVCEHTTIAKTILERFCPNEDLREMGDRLETAPSLAAVLQPVPRSSIPLAPSPPTLTSVGTPLVVGGASLQPSDFNSIDRSELQRHLRALKLRLLSEGMPPDVV